MLNQTQAALLKTILDEGFNNILASNASDALKIAAIYAIGLPHIPETLGLQLTEHNILKSVEFLHKIYNHPNPQNRAVGQIAPVQYGYVSWQDKDKNEIISERVGLLSLTARQNPNEQAVTKKDVTDAIEAAAAIAIEQIKNPQVEDKTEQEEEIDRAYLALKEVVEASGLELNSALAQKMPAVLRPLVVEKKIPPQLLAEISLENIMRLYIPLVSLFNQDIITFSEYHAFPLASKKILLEAIRSGVKDKNILNDLVTTLKSANPFSTLLFYRWLQESGGLVQPNFYSDLNNIKKGLKSVEAHSKKLEEAAAGITITASQMDLLMNVPMSLLYMMINKKIPLAPFLQIDKSSLEKKYLLLIDYFISNKISFEKYHALSDVNKTIVCFFALATQNVSANSSENFNITEWLATVPDQVSRGFTNLLSSKPMDVLIVTYPQRKAALLYFILEQPPAENFHFNMGEVIPQYTVLGDIFANNIITMEQYRHLSEAKRKIFKFFIQGSAYKDSNDKPFIQKIYTEISHAPDDLASSLENAIESIENNDAVSLVTEVKNANTVLTSLNKLLDKKAKDEYKKILDIKSGLYKNFMGASLGFNFADEHYLEKRLRPSGLVLNSDYFSAHDKEQYETSCKDINQMYNSIYSENLLSKTDPDLKHYFPKKSYALQSLRSNALQWSWPADLSAAAFLVSFLKNVEHFNDHDNLDKWHEKLLQKETLMSLSNEQLYALFDYFDKNAKLSLGYDSVKTLKNCLFKNTLALSAGNDQETAKNLLSLAQDPRAQKILGAGTSDSGANILAQYKAAPEEKQTEVIEFAKKSAANLQ